jgi:hypothetical protein
MLAALLFAVGEHRGALREATEIQHMRAEAHAPHP